MPAIVAVSQATLALALALDRTVVFTMSDPRTALLTRRIGIEMHQVGRLVDFRGQRGIFRIDLADVLASLRTEWRPAVMRLIERARQITSVHAIGTQSPFAA